METEEYSKLPAMRQTQQEPARWGGERMGISYQESSTIDPSAGVQAYAMDVQSSV
jgi:hypothetical protein